MNMSSVCEYVECAYVCGCTIQRQYPQPPPPHTPHTRVVHTHTHMHFITHTPGRSTTDVVPTLSPARPPLRRVISQRESSSSFTTNGLPSYNPSMASLRGLLASPLPLAPPPPTAAPAQGPTPTLSASAGPGRSLLTETALHSRDLARHDAAQVVSIALSRSQSRVDAGDGRGASSQAMPIPQARRRVGSQPALASINTRGGEVEEDEGRPRSPLVELVCAIDDQWRKGCMTQIS